MCVCRKRVVIYIQSLFNLFVYISIGLYIYISPFIHVIIRLFFVSVTVHLPLRLLIFFLSIRLSIHRSLYQSIYSSVRLSLSQPPYLSLFHLASILSIHLYSKIVQAFPLMILEPARLNPTSTASPHDFPVKCRLGVTNNRFR